MDTTSLELNVTSFEEHNCNIIITNAIVGSAMTIVTFCGQLLVFIIIYYDKRLQTPNNYYVISLASADLLIALISMPVWTIFTTLNYWPFSLLFCDIWNSLDHVLCGISIHTIVFISFERYKSVSNPIKHRALLTGKRMKICLGIIWIADWIIWFFYIFITEYLHGQNKDLRDCSASYFKSQTFSMIIGIVGVPLPVFATAVMYIFTFQIARKAGDINPNAVPSEKKSLECPADLSEATTENTGSKSLGSLHVQDSDKTVKEDKKISTHNCSKGSKENKERKALKTIALLFGHIRFLLDAHGNRFHH